MENKTSNSRLEPSQKPSHFLDFKILLACGIYLLSTAIFFWPTITSNYVPLPTDLVTSYLRGEPAHGANNLIRDPIVQMYPYSDFIFNSYKQGILPLWNPYIFSGLNFANGQSAAFSPLNILIPFFNDSLSFFTFTIILYFFIAGLGMYLFLRKNTNQTIAIIGGLAWQLSGPMMMWLSWGTIDGVLAIFPLLLLAIQKSISLKSWKWLLAMTFFHYWLLTSGHMQFYLLATVCTVSYGIFCFIKNRQQQKPKDIISYLTVILINIALAALIILPFIQQSSVSHRLQRLNYSHLEIQHIVQLLMPNIWGTANHYLTNLNYVETTSYVGLVILVLFIVGLTFRAFIKKQDIIFGLAIAVIVSVYNFFPGIFQPLGKFIPLFLNAPPFRSIFIISSVIIIIAAYSLSWCLEQDKKIQQNYWYRTFAICCLLALISIVLAKVFHQFDTAKHAIFFLALLAVAAILLAQKPTLQKIILPLLLVVIFFDQFFIFHDFTPQQSRAPFLNPPSYIRCLQEKFRSPLIYSEVSPFNMYGLYNIRSIFGYDTTYPEEYFQKISKHGVITSDHNMLNAQIADLEFLNQLGVNAIVTKRKLALPLLCQDTDILVYALQSK